MSDQRKKGESTFPGVGWSMLALGLVCAVAAHPDADTAMQYNLTEVLNDRFWGGLACYLLMIAAVFFVVQWLLLHLKRRQWLAWAPFVLSVVLLLMSELFWKSGGWDRLGASFVWAVGFPCFCGSGFSVLLWTLSRRSRPVKIVGCAGVVVAVVLAAAFWPRMLEDKLILEPEWTMLSYDREGTVEWRKVKDGEEFRTAVRWARVTPCILEPQWEKRRCVLVRLDESHVLWAPHHDTPYIYEYTGALEEFDGGPAKWRVFHYPALGDNLRGMSRTMEP